MFRAHPPCNIADLRAIARRRLPRVVRDYVDGGAEDEVTLHANRSAFEGLQLLPRTMVNVSGRSLATTLLGKTWDAPFGIAPMGASGLVWHQADLALAQAARAANLPFVLSTHAFVRAPDVAQASGTAPWFQLYMSPERKRTFMMLAEAAQAGCDTLVLTTDVPVGGKREYNDRNGFSMPPRPGLQHVLDGLAHPRWLAGVFARSRLFSLAHATAMAGWHERRDALDWRDFIGLRQAWRGKLLIKGILHAEDAVLAADLGADGIIVSNHGGRQLDGAPPSIEVLPGIVAALNGRIPVIIDSGFRRGSDIVKALALGASFVLVGRPALYGAAAAGREGVQLALRILTGEVDRTLALIGCPAVSMLGPQFIRLSGVRQGAAVAPQTTPHSVRPVVSSWEPRVLPLRRPPGGKRDDPAPTGAGTH